MHTKSPNILAAILLCICIFPFKYCKCGAKIAAPTAESPTKPRMPGLFAGTPSIRKHQYIGVATAQIIPRTEIVKIILRMMWEYIVKWGYTSRDYCFAERPRWPIPTCFWRDSCPRSGSRRHDRSAAGIRIRSIGSLAIFFIESKTPMPFHLLKPASQ